MFIPMQTRLLDTLRRDLGAVFGPLLGRRLPSALPRDGEAWRVHRVAATPRLRPLDAAVLPNEPQPLSVTLGGRVLHAEVQRGQTLLRAGLAAGIGLPHSCTLGGCGACRVRLTEGEVRMKAPNCLSNIEREAGYVLACMSHPLGPVSIAVDAR